MSGALLPTLEQALADGGARGASTWSCRSRRALLPAGARDFAALLAAQPAAPPPPAATLADDIAFWLYSSGSTGRPKGTVHTHAQPVLDGGALRPPVLGLREDDVVFSAAKLFFAYGLGNALTFPLSVGATTILMAERPTPAGRVQAARRSASRRSSTACRRSTPRCSPRPTCRRAPTCALRLCASAGEALPREIGERFTAHFGCEILDGIGSTEMLHIFLSNRPGDVRYGTTGVPVPGYDIELRGEDGRPGRRRRDRRPLHPRARAPR